MPVDPYGTLDDTQPIVWIEEEPDPELDELMRENESVTGGGGGASPERGKKRESENPEATSPIGQGEEDPFELEDDDPGTHTGP